MVKIALVVPCENFIADAAQILSQHNQFHEQEDSETYVMDEIIPDTYRSTPTSS